MKVLVVSDQPLTVIALQSMLRHARPQLQLFDATHVGEALQTLRDEGPFNLVLFDLDMHGVRRASGAALLRQMWPSVPLALVSELRHDEDVTSAADLDVAGHLLMSESTEALWKALALLVTVRSPAAELAC